jgi:hypothetical protein
LKGNTLKGNILKGNILKGNILKGNILKGNIVKGNSLKGNIVKGNTLKGNILKGNIVICNVPLHFYHSLLPFSFTTLGVHSLSLSGDRATPTEKPPTDPVLTTPFLDAIFRSL